MDVENECAYAWTGVMLERKEKLCGKASMTCMYDVALQ